MSRKSIMLGSALLLILLLLAAAIFLPGFFKNYSDSQLAAASVQNLLNAESYRFTSSSILYLPTEKRVFSQIKGEKSQEIRHISGAILGTPVDIYYADGAFYQKDAVSGAWFVTGEADLAESAVLLSELDPARDFNFTDYGQITYLGKVKKDGETLLSYEMIPVLTDRWIAKYFNPVTYLLKVTKEGLLREVQITGQSVETPDSRLVIDSRFYDYNKEIPITLPQIGSK